MRIQDVSPEDLPEAMNDREKWSGKSVLVARHNDDDDDTFLKGSRLKLRVIARLKTKLASTISQFCSLATTSRGLSHKHLFACLLGFMAYQLL